MRNALKANPGGPTMAASRNHYRKSNPQDTTTMAKKSKFFRVAREGATTDGRQIERSWIEQIVKNFNRETYSPRVWLEHMRSIYPDSMFKAYGDVTAVEARNGEDGKLELFAQIEPLPELEALNKARQKLFTSIEVHPKFADTGEAYLTGLAVTDSPASLGTEMLAFAQQNPTANPLAARKSDPATLFTQAVETALVFEEDADTEGMAAKFTASLKALRDKFSTKGKTDDARFAEVLAGFEQFAELAQSQGTAHDALAKSHAKLASDFATLQTAYGDLVKKLEGTTAQNHNQRQAATGAQGYQQTDC
jgi:hypothetical protein